jgi:hypothetical protein
MASGGHGLLKVSPGPAMPYPSYGRFRGDSRAGRAAYGRFLPFWTPMIKDVDGMKEVRFRKDETIEDKVQKSAKKSILRRNK